VLAQNAARIPRVPQQQLGIAAAHPACPGAGDCCDPAGNDTPGCDDEDCCNLICDTLDPFCCDSFWDPLCTLQAIDVCEVCGCCGCIIECPPDALDEGEPCLSDGDLDVTNGGCGGAFPPLFTDASCGDTFCGLISTYVAGGNPMRDTDWYMVDHPGGVINGILASKFPGVCFIVDGVGPGGNPCDPIVVGDIGCGDECDNTAVASADLPPGTVVVFVSSGTCDGSGIYEGLPCDSSNEYVLTIECACACQDDDDCPPGYLCVDCQCIPAPPPNDECVDAILLDVEAGGSVTVEGSSIGALDDDPQCVVPSTAPGVWYRVKGNGNTMTVSTCNQADFDTRISIFCGTCYEGGGSDCCIANGTPGCDDPDCEAIVCAVDPFCCDVAWDGICADEAGELCGICIPSMICVDGSDDTPGCAGFTTEVSWCAQNKAEYSILVHGSGSATGDFTLTVSDDGNECTPTVDCPAQCLTDQDCPPGHACVDGKCVPILIGGRLDIKPGSCPNSYNNKGTGNGKLPVSLVGTSEVDAALIDPSTLLLSRADGVGGTVAPLPHFTRIGDDAAPFDGEPCGCHELEGDGVPDLKMKFHRTTVTEALGLGDLPGNAVVELVLTGNLTDGRPFEARDCIRIVPAGPAAY
jgi:hypothetical protein